MSKRFERTHLYSQGETDWPTGPISLWQKIGGVLSIVMLLGLVALVSLSEDRNRRTRTFDTDQLATP
jgi:hypothetical protein